MPVLPARLGTDLHLMRALDLRHSSRDPGNDLATWRRPGGSGLDLDTLSGADNLVQALLMRFLTPQGELAALGHPEYGSRLFDLIGELNNDTTRNRAKLYVLQALAAEPRVKDVVSVKVTPNRASPTQLDIAITLRAVDSDTPLNLVFPFFLERGRTP